LYGIGFVTPENGVILYNVKDLLDFGFKSLQAEVYCWWRGMNSLVANGPGFVKVLANEAYDTGVEDSAIYLAAAMVHQSP